jgi:hypothetical protein
MGFCGPFAQPDPADRVAQMTNARGQRACHEERCAEGHEQNGCGRRGDAEPIAQRRALNGSRKDDERVPAGDCRSGIGDIDVGALSIRIAHDA